MTTNGTAPPNPAETLSNDNDLSAGAVDFMVLHCLEIADDDGEHDLIVELIDLYLADAIDRLGAIAVAISNKDSESLKRSTHVFKGSSSSLGAVQLAVDCERMQGLADDGAWAKIQTLYRALQDEFVRVRRTLIAEREVRQRCDY